MQELDKQTLMKLQIQRQLKDWLEDVKQRNNVILYAKHYGFESIKK